MPPSGVFTPAVRVPALIPYSSLNIRWVTAVTPAHGLIMLSGLMRQAPHLGLIYQMSLKETRQQLVQRCKMIMRQIQRD